MKYRVLLFMLFLSMGFYYGCKKPSDQPVTQYSSAHIADTVAGNYLVTGTYYSWDSLQNFDTAIAQGKDTLFITKTDDSTVLLAGRGVSLHFDSLASKSITWCFDFDFYSTADTLRFIKSDHDSIWAGFYSGTTASGSWYNFKGRKIH